MRTTDPTTGAEPVSRPRTRHLVAVRPPDTLPGELDRWVEHGFITPQQADRIRRFEAVAPPVEPVRVRTSLVTEALGYVGGVLMLIAAALLVGQMWTDLSETTRLALPLGAAILMAVVGALLPRPLTAALVRLRAVLWVLSLGAWTGFLALLGADTLEWSGRRVSLLVGVGAAAYAAVLWAFHRTVLQQAAFAAALAGASAGLAAQFDGHVQDTVGLAIWGVGLVWLLLGWGRVVGPRMVTDVIGGLLVVVGAQLTMLTDWGNALALLTVAALVTLGTLQRDLVLLAVGAYGTLTVVPGVMSRYFENNLAGGLGLLLGGAVLVVAAAFTARRRKEQPSPHEARLASGTAFQAVAAATVAVVAVTTAVLAVGLTV